MTLYTGEAVDLAKFLTRLPFSTTGLSRKKHIPGWQFAGPGTELAALLGVPQDSQQIIFSNDDEPQLRPINYLDEQAKYYDIRYYNIEHKNELTDEQKMDAKHRADPIMIEAIQKYSLYRLKERFYS